MKIFSRFNRFKFIIPSILLLTFIIPAYTQANDYKWLKSANYKNIFVYSDFSECGVIADKLNEAVQRILKRSDIKASISNSLVFQTTDRRDKSAKELIDQDLITDNKIILYIYGKCIEYNSVYIYQIDLHFALFNKKYSQALLYSSPQHSVMGADTIRGIDRKFRKLMENALSDYLSANKGKTK